MLTSWRAPQSTSSQFWNGSSCSTLRAFRSRRRKSRSRARKARNRGLDPSVERCWAFLASRWLGSAPCKFAACFGRWPSSHRDGLRPSHGAPCFSRFAFLASMWRCPPLEVEQPLPQCSVASPRAARQDKHPWAVFNSAALLQHRIRFYSRGKASACP